MKKASVHNFQCEVDCIYDDEQYSVRDNGAVLRHPRTGKRPRPTDGKWVFGKPNSQNGYMYISQKRIHRIVATAFHGTPHTTEHVVDHVDTNRQNNRPENLRWVTRLENALKNPVTRKKIEYLCGSIEAFLENPSMLNDLQGDPSFKWMRTVTPEEAKNCRVRMSAWANSNKKPKRSTHVINHKNSFGERVFKPLQKWEVGLGREPGLELALTPWCAQYMWRASAYYPCCPQESGTDPLNDYFQNLKAGDVLAYSEHEDIFPELSVLESKILKEKSSIVVMSKRADSKWLIVGIELDERSKHFIHFGLGLYSIKDEANKAFGAKNELTDFWSEGYANGGL
jgi:hypothetical protein